MDWTSMVSLETLPLPVCVNVSVVIILPVIHRPPPVIPQHLPVIPRHLPVTQ